VIGILAENYETGEADDFGGELFKRSAVVKRSYSRAIFRSFHITQCHSYSAPNSLTSCGKSCESGVSIEGAEVAENQIPASALT
jgi:hypothetical protein